MQWFNFKFFSRLQEDFEEQLKAAGDKLVLVDFFATWCGPCKMIAPKLEEHSKTYAERLVVLKVFPSIQVATNATT